MKIVTWNVNGLRACFGKGFEDFFREADADVFCVQETKLQRGDLDFEPEGYHGYWNDAAKKGYSGTAVFSKRLPEAVTHGIGTAEHDGEGRVITLEYGECFLVNVYVPNAQEELRRLPYRMTWDEAFREYLKKLDADKPVIVCGDLNVAHQEIDLKNPAANRRNAGFTDEEREGFTQLLSAGFADVFRRLNPEAKDAYTYWSYRFGARFRNAGWRIDYFCVSERLMDKAAAIDIHSGVMGSDHCPVSLTMA
jgi:exodeoxyribonuclease-3